MRFLNLDSPLIKFLNMIADVMIISGLWLLGSIPIVTIGASTSAAYYVLTRRISNRENYIVRDFFKAYKENFVTAVLVFLTLAAAFYITWFNSNNSQAYGPVQVVAAPLNMILAIEAAMVYIHVFPLMSRFDMKYRALMKSAFLMANRHLPTSVAHAALLAVILVACWFVPILLLFAFGAYCWISSYMMMRIYRKYRPEMDKDPEEEI